MKDNCKDMHESHDIPQDYNIGLLVKWQMEGTIGSDGEAGLDDEGALFTFDYDCNSISDSSWNGGRGRPEPIKFATVDDKDVFFSVEMANPLFTARGPGIDDPKNIKVVDADGNGQSGWVVDIECGKGFSKSDWGWAWWKKNCWIKAERSNCKDVDIPIPGTGAQVCWDE